MDAFGIDPFRDTIDALQRDQRTDKQLRMDMVGTNVYSCFHFVKLRKQNLVQV